MLKKRWIQSARSTLSEDLVACSQDHAPTLPAADVPEAPHRHAAAMLYIAALVCSKPPRMYPKRKAHCAYVCTLGPKKINRDVATML